MVTYFIYVYVRKPNKNFIVVYFIFDTLTQNTDKVRKHHKLNRMGNMIAYDEGGILLDLLERHMEAFLVRFKLFNSIIVIDNIFIQDQF